MKHDKRITRRLFALLLSLALIVSLTACADLGNFNADDDYQSFYDSIGEVEGLFDGGSHGYDLERSLFNAYSIEKSDWEDDDDRVAYEEYVYIVIPFKAALTVESIALGMNSDVAMDVEVSAFYFESASLAPAKIKYKSSPDTEIITVEEDGVEVQKEVEIVYDDPATDERLAGVVCYVKSDWGSFLMEGFSQPGFTDGCLHTVDGGLLYLRIENNSGLNKQMKNCSFNFINLMVRAI